MNQTEQQQQQQRSANAVSGKTARACDSCLRRRARWYCAADDAFLCQSCDSSVHSANPLASRHDRVRLKTASSRSLDSLQLNSPLSDNDSSLPAWHQGFKRKARTPRHAKASTVASKPVLLVPDLETVAEDVNEIINEEEEEQLLYQVPIFDPVLAEFSTPLNFDDMNQSIEEVKLSQLFPAGNIQNHNFGGFEPSDIELAEFAADVENLLGQGLDDIDSFGVDGLGLLETKEDKGQVKTELMDAIDSSESNKNANFTADTEMDFSQESLDFNFDSGSPASGGEGDEQKVQLLEEHHVSMNIGLRLDYESVIDAWSCQGGSPWTDGVRPQYNLDDCWPDFMGTWGTPIGGEMQGASCGLGIGQVGNCDGGREARVSRYREKRRTRLFSKKIRYEVRKLNAEKRPRMKGRFVKRSSFPIVANATAGSSGFSYA